LVPQADGSVRKVALTRIHLEEDAGKNVHTDAGSEVDLNRSGVPLVEIVGEPVLHSAEEASDYLKALRLALIYLGINDGNLEEGSFRCDANVSVRRKGSEKLGTRVELKNINSFRFVRQAIEHEIERQVAVYERGEKVQQETRLFDNEKGETRPMRSKEEANDYRYFPDPDLLPLVVTEKMVDDVRRTMPELPAAARAQLTTEYGLSAYEADLMTQSRAWLQFYKNLVKHLGGGQKLAASWMLGEFSGALNRGGMDIGGSPIDEARFAGLLRRVQDNTISGRAAKEVFDAMWNDVIEADAVIEAKGLKQISDSGAIEKLVDEAIAAGAKQVEDYRAGKEKALQSLVGQVMKASKGKANPAQVNEILRRKLAR
jgi:aspartyl-tRNA(Asn)/glutamyl-tRNA(Gln) amidotransferase subunit B